MKNTSMTDQEFNETMDSLIEKGLVEIGITANGEIGFVPTVLAREAFKEELHGDSTAERHARTQ